MQKTLRYKGYIGTVDYSQDSVQLYGHIMHIGDCVLYSGRTLKELRQSFRHAVDGYLEVCQEVGKVAAVSDSTPRRESV